jgi:uncharacterized protein (DUF58 family)
MLTTHAIVEKVRRVELRTSKLANDLMTGAYQSQFKGRGMDFEELREYVPGDDVRTIDWNVTARMRRPFVKLHREERELAVMLVLDISASGLFGSSDRSKREFATEVAATLAFSALRNGDKVGLILFSEDVEVFVPAKKGRKHLLRIIREALAFPAKKRGTNIGAALNFMNHVVHRRAVVFLITDFLHSFDAKSGQRDLFRELGQTNSRHDLVCVHLHDEREANVPPAGMLLLEDAETGELLELDTIRNSVRAAFSEAASKRIEVLDRSLTQTAVDVVRLAPRDDFPSILQRFFETRRRR